MAKQDKKKKFIKRKLLTKSSTKKESRSSENESLKSMPVRLQQVHQFTKNYNVDRKVSPERVGSERTDSILDEKLQQLDRRFNRF